MTKNNLPNLLIVGAAKSGTTSLHNYLNQHPEIFMSHHKEPHFLISNEIGETRIPNSILEISEYSDLFDHSDNFKYKGESSVMYLLYPDIAINNIKKFLGKECKIIIMLRNPIDRAFSGYQHVKRYNTMENLSFEDALWNSDDRYHNNLNMTPASRYLALGKYYLQVKKFKESFKNVHIIIYDDYKKDINKELNQLINFLKLKLFDFDIKDRYMVGGWQWKNKKIRNFMMSHSYVKKILKFVIPFKKARSLVKKKLQYKINNKISVDTKKKLITYYKEDIIKLSKLINRDLNYWLK